MSHQNMRLLPVYNLYYLSVYPIFREPLRLSPIAVSDLEVGG